MAVGRPGPSVSALRARYEQRAERLTALRHVRSELVSMAGLIGKPVRNQAGQQIGHVADVVARWDSNQAYPPVTGLIVRVGQHHELRLAARAGRYPAGGGARPAAAAAG
jgi:hypothetical protein